MMAVVALVAVLLAAGGDFARRRWRLIDLETVCYIENEPLASPTRVKAIDGARFILEDGREVRFDEDPAGMGLLSADDLSLQEFLVEVQADADDTARVYTKRRRFFCGTGMDLREPLFRVPVVTRTIHLNQKDLIGTGRIVEGAAVSSVGDRRTPAM
jgi:hypothetical protein